MTCTLSASSKCSDTLAGLSQILDTHEISTKISRSGSLLISDIFNKHLSSLCRGFRCVCTDAQNIKPVSHRQLVALLSLSSWCPVMVVWLFLAVPWVCLWFVIVVFPDFTHLQFLTSTMVAKVKSYMYILDAYADIPIKICSI